MYENCDYTKQYKDWKQLAKDAGYQVEETQRKDYFCLECTHGPYRALLKYEAVYRRLGDYSFGRARFDAEIHTKLYLSLFDEDGDESRIAERWEFDDESEITWILSHPIDLGDNPYMWEAA